MKYVDELIQTFEIDPEDLTDKGKNKLIKLLLKERKT